ncbi:hypothetical protein [Kitasatospora sp. NPDC004272]
MSVRLPEEPAALREPLSDRAARQHSDTVVAVGEDRGPDHGRLCGDALRAVALPGPDADWRADGYAAHPVPAGHGRSRGAVTPFTFDAALVGIGNGRTVVAVATGED